MASQDSADGCGGRVVQEAGERLLQYEAGAKSGDSQFLKDASKLALVMTEQVAFNATPQLISGNMTKDDYLEGYTGARMQALIDAVVLPGADYIDEYVSAVANETVATAAADEEDEICVFGNCFTVMGFYGSVGLLGLLVIGVVGLYTHVKKLHKQAQVLALQVEEYEEQEEQRKAKEAKLTVDVDTLRAERHAKRQAERAKKTYALRLEKEEAERRSLQILLKQQRAYLKAAGIKVELPDPDAEDLTPPDEEKLPDGEGAPDGRGREQAG